MYESTISAAGMRIVRLLVGNLPRTVADLIDATGVTRTAVTEQLNELVAAGFIERSTQRLPGRGRPRHLYSATGAALLLLFASNQQLVVPAIWSAMREVGGRELVEQVLSRVSRAMADHYKERINGRTPRQRFRELIEILREEGVLVEFDEDGRGHIVMHKRSCPFIGMYEETGVVCCVDREMMSQVVGARVKRTACRHEGAPCCSFEISSTNGK